MTNLEQARLSQKARQRSVRKEIQVGDTKTAYWSYPTDGRSAVSRAIILIHGYRGNHHGLEAIAGALPGIEIYIPDLPGFGQSQPFRASHTIEHYANWLHEFILALNLAEKPHLLGHSFGSIVVSAYAAEHDDIESLVLENPVAAPALKGPKAMLTQLAKAFFWLAGALPEKFGDWILQSWPMVRGMSIVMTKSRISELRAWIHEQHDQNFNDYANRRVALEGYAASITSCVGDFASQFRVPTLMLVGDRDDITSVKQQHQLFAQLPGDENLIKVFSGVGHLTHYEIPEKIAQSIEHWCNRD